MVFIHPCIAGARPSTSISKFNVPLSNGCMNEWMNKVCSVIHHRTQDDSPLKSVLSVFLTSRNANFSLVNTEIAIRLNIYPREKKSSSACRKIKHIHADTKEMLQFLQMLFCYFLVNLHIWKCCNLIQQNGHTYQLILSVKKFCHSRHRNTWE